MTTYFGSNFDKTLSRTEIAKRIRADLKGSGLPKGCKVSVTCSRGSAIDVKITAFPGQVLNPARVAFERTLPHEVCQLPRFTLEVARAIATITEIGDAYRRDDSDSMTDYFNCNFYLFVGVAHELERESRTATETAHAELLADLAISARHDRGFAEAQIEALEPNGFRGYWQQEAAIKAAA